MSVLKKYRELKAGMSELASTIGGLREAKSRLFAELKPLEHEALKADIGGEPSAKGLVEAFAEKKAKHQALGLELEEAEARLRAYQEVVPPMKGEASTALWDEFRPGLEQKVKALAAAFKAAEAAEKDLAEAREAVNESFHKLALPVPFQQPWLSILLRKSGEADWETTLRKLKYEGYGLNL